jgi:uncharacterized protein (DUF433 family)
MEDVFDWSGCPLVSIDADVVHGAPVFKDTRLPIENVVTSVYAYEELQAMTEDQAIEATLRSFPTTPGGAAAVRQVLAYYEAHQPQLAP